MSGECVSVVSVSHRSPKRPYVRGRAERSGESAENTHHTHHTHTVESSVERWARLLNTYRGMTPEAARKAAEAIERLRADKRVQLCDSHSSQLLTVNSSTERTGQDATQLDESSSSNERTGQDGKAQLESDSSSEKGLA